jgi:hypothetical protein
VEDFSQILPRLTDAELDQAEASMNRISELRSVLKSAQVDVNLAESEFKGLIQIFADAVRDR